MDKNLSILVKFAALDKLTAPLRRMGAGARESGKDLAATRREVVALERSASKIGAFRDQQAQLAKTSEKLGYARERVDALRAAMDEAGAPTKRLAAQLLVAERNVEKFQTSTTAQTGRLDDLGRELREAGIDVGRLAEEEERLGRSITDVNGRMDKQRAIARQAAAADKTREKISAAGDRLQGAGIRTAAGGALLAAPLVIGTRAAIDFEAAMADVKKVFNGTPADFAALNSEVLDLSKRVPVAAEGLAAIVASGAQSGIEGPANLIAYAEAAAKMGVAFGLTADVAGETMSAWRAGLGLTQPQVEVLADKVNYLGNVSGAKAPAIAEITKRIGPLGQVGGLAAGEIAALGATLSAMGIESEIAATGIKNTVLTLTKGASATKGQQAAFKQLGLESSTVAKSMQRDAAGTITDVMRRIAKLPKASQAGLLGELFGSESVGAIAPLLTQLPRLEENLRRVGDASLYTGSMQQEFLGQTGTAAARLELMKNKVEAMKVRIGDRLLPIVASAADRFGVFVDRVSAFAERNPGAMQAIILTTSALALLMTIVGSLAVAIGTTLGPISFLVGALKTPAAAATLLQRSLQLMFAPFQGGLALLGRATPLLMRLSGLFRLLLSPIGMIGRVAMMALSPLIAIFGALSLPVIAAVAVITAVLVGFAAFVYNNWGGIKAFFASVWSSLMAATAPLRASLGRLGAALGALGTAFLGWVGRVVGPFVGAIARIGSAIGAFFAPAVRWVGALVGPIALKAWSSFGALVGSAIGGIVNKLKGLVDWITKGVGWLTKLLNAGAQTPSVAPKAAALPGAVPKIAGKRAAGGPVMGGKLYLVGERGPELFEAPGNGRIVPNHKLGRGLAAGAAAALTAMPIAAAPPPISPTLRVKPAASPVAATSGGAPANGSRRVFRFTGPITIQVTGAAGQDPEAIARAVADEFEHRASAEAATHASSYEDVDD